MSLELGLIVALVLSLMAVSALTAGRTYRRMQRARWRRLQIQLVEQQADQRIRQLTRAAMQQMLAEVRRRQS